jgi:hypothetical protein
LIAISYIADIELWASGVTVQEYGQGILWQEESCHHALSFVADQLIFQPNSILSSLFFLGIRRKYLKKLFL